jgi:cell division protein ZapA (FtsZ GTPase activity inhibitor)
MHNPHDSQTVTVSVLGRDLRLRSDEPQERLSAIAASVEACATAVNRGRAPTLDVQLLIATAFQLAAEVDRLQREHAALVDRMRASSRELLGRLGQTQVA